MNNANHDWRSWDVGDTIRLVFDGKPVSLGIVTEKNSDCLFADFDKMRARIDDWTQNMFVKEEKVVEIGRAKNEKNGYDD